MDKEQAARHQSDKAGRMNRRDFARMAALGAVGASALGSKAEAQDCTGCGTDEFCQVTTPCCGAYVGVRCASGLKALQYVDARPNITVAEVVYGPLDSLLDSLITGERNVGDADIVSLLLNLQGTVQAFDNAAGFKSTLGDLLVYDESVSPRRTALGELWRNVYAAARDERNGKVFWRHYPLMFLDLKPRSHMSRERQRIERFIYDAPDQPSDFAFRVGHYRFIDLYCKKRNEVCLFPGTTVYDEVGWLLIREAFDSGMFKLRSDSGREPNCANGTRAEIKNNGECWSTSNPTGCEDGDDEYCNEVDGAPSASSDVCD